MGPMKAACDFGALLKTKGVLSSTERIQAELFGSLALTGRGHATDRAVMIGLNGNLPDSVGSDHSRIYVGSHS